METANFEDHYQTLGVSVDADALEIRRAFREKVKEIHPDVAADKQGATEAFIRLKEAYNVLSDPVRRSHYDIVRANHQARQRETRSGRRTAGPGPASPGGYGPAGAGPPRDMGSPSSAGGAYGRYGSDTWDRYQRSLTVAELLQRAMREIAAGRYRHAGRDLSEILAREPENPDALILMGRLYQSEGRVAEWIRVLEEGVRKNPSHVALRMALNEARRVATEQPGVLVTDEDRQSRRTAYLAGGLITGALAFLWGILTRGHPFFLSTLVPVMAPLMTGTMLCALIAGWTMAATGFIACFDEELFYPDTLGRSLHRKTARGDAPLGLAVPVMALIHYALAVSVMAGLMLLRGVISRSLLIVTATAFLLSAGMAMAYPPAVSGIMTWCPGWLLFALFCGWLVGDFFRP